MTHYIIELALWILGLFLLGCAIGAIGRHLFGTAENSPPSAAETPEPEPDAPQA